MVPFMAAGDPAMPLVRSAEAVTGEAVAVPGEAAVVARMPLEAALAGRRRSPRAGAVAVDGEAVRA